MNGQWVIDYDFEKLMRYIQNNSAIVRLERIIQEFMKYRKRESIRFIINSYIGGNNLAYYIFKRLNLSYSNSDAQEIEMIKKQYEQKIDEYLKRLEQMENNRTNDKTAVSDNTISEIKDVKNEDKSWELSNEEETAFREGEKDVISKHETGEVTDRGTSEEFQK